MNNEYAHIREFFTLPLPPKNKANLDSFYKKCIPYIARVDRFNNVMVKATFRFYGPKSKLFGLSEMANVLIKVLRRRRVIGGNVVIDSMDLSYGMSHRQMPHIVTANIAVVE